MEPRGDVVGPAVSHVGRLAALHVSHGDEVGAADRLSANQHKGSPGAGTVATAATNPTALPTDLQAPLDTGRASARGNAGSPGHFSENASTAAS